MLTTLLLDDVIDVACIVDSIDVVCIVDVIDVVCIVDVIDVICIVDVVGITVIPEVKETDVNLVVIFEVIVVVEDFKAFKIL